MLVTMLAPFVVCRSLLAVVHHFEVMSKEIAAWEYTHVIYMPFNIRRRACVGFLRKRPMLRCSYHLSSRCARLEAISCKPRSTGLEMGDRHVVLR